MDVQNPQIAELEQLLWRMRDGAIDDAGLARIEALVTGDAEVRRYYIRYSTLCGGLRWLNAGDGERGSAGFGVGESKIAADRFAPAAEAAAAPPSVVSLSPLPIPLSSPFIGSPVFSYMVATLIVGVMLLSAWAYKISHSQLNTDNLVNADPSNNLPEPAFVGRITGMTKCRWSAPETQTYLWAFVPLGRKYALASGLLEITYNSGAKVILEGPCTYEVQSAVGGYLALGKLTALVEKREEGREKREAEGLAASAASVKPHAANRKSPSSFILHPSSLFSVRTPTAVVTDLGTEFGVEVGKDGSTTSLVFQGRVRMQAVGGNSHRGVVLHANESARVEKGDKLIKKADRAALPCGTFVRRMPKREPFDVFSTGIGVKEGDRDPHWKMVARSDDPSFKPQPAVVISITSPFFRLNDSASQWISTDNYPDLPDNTTFTFRTTFEITDAAPESAVLQGGFIVDNAVTAIRLNGRIVPVPEQQPSSLFYSFHSFKITRGFVKGTNTLEIDVFNKPMGANAPPGKINPMSLRVQLRGYLLCDAGTSTDVSSTTDKRKTQ